MVFTWGGSNGFLGIFLLLNNAKIMFKTTNNNNKYQKNSNTITFSSFTYLSSNGSKLLKYFLLSKIDEVELSEIFKRKPKPAEKPKEEKPKKE